MTEAGSIFLGKNVAGPALGRAGILGHFEPRGGVGKFAARLATIGDEVDLAVAVDVGLQHAVDADQFVVRHSHFPFVLQRVCGTLEPSDQARLVACPDEVGITIAVHGEGFPVDEVSPLGLVNHDDLPVVSDE